MKSAEKYYGHNFEKPVTNCDQLHVGHNFRSEKMICFVVNNIYIYDGLKYVKSRRNITEVVDCEF